MNPIDFKDKACPEKRASAERAVKAVSETIEIRALTGSYFVGKISFFFKDLF